MFSRAVSFREYSLIGKEVSSMFVFSNPQGLRLLSDEFSTSVCGCKGYCNGCKSKCSGACVGVCS